MFGERERHMRWLVVHASEGGYHALTAEVLAYVQAQYTLRQITYVAGAGHAVPQTLVLERGGTSSLEDLGANELVRNRASHRQWERVYETTRERVRLAVIER